jgi:hypothetical protein
MKNGAFIMRLMSSRTMAVAAYSGAVFLLGSVPAWAGLPVPAPLAGVTGPIGIMVAGVAYGGYLLFRRYRNRS